MDEGHVRNMSTMSVVSNSSVEIDSDSSNDASSKDDGPGEQKFILRNELYNSLLASALGKTVLNRHLNFKEQGINFNLANLKDNLNALGALKELKDLKGLTVSSVPAFPRNLALHREDHDEVRVSTLRPSLFSLFFFFFFHPRIFIRIRSTSIVFLAPFFLFPFFLFSFILRRMIVRQALLSLETMLLAFFFREISRSFFGRRKGLMRFRDWREMEWNGWLYIYKNCSKSKSNFIIITRRIGLNEFPWNHNYREERW